jgi:hypothetical protein
MDPINYSVDVANPFQSALQGYQAGAAIRNDQQQQAQQQAVQAQQQALQKLYAETAANPSADNYSRLMLADPKSSEGIQRAWTVKNTQQQQSHTADLLRWGAAIKSGKPGIAAEQLRQRADSLDQQSGAPSQESQALRTQAQLMEEHPEFALGQIQALLAANPNGKDAAETLGKFGSEQRAQELQPAALKKADADANSAVSDSQTKAVVAKFAEPQALKDLELKGWNIENIKSEIGYRKEANRIAAMGVALAQKKDAREAEELRLKIDAAKTALDEKTRAKVADVESATSSIDNLLNTADRLLTAGTEIVDRNGEKVAIPNSTLRAATGPLDSRLPTIQRDVADLEALAETLGSQAFISQIEKMKGTGALSEKEGDKLQSSLTNLSLRQSPEQLIANVKEAQRLMLKARGNVEKRYGVKAGVPDTPAVQTPGADIDALVKKYGAAPKAGGG